ncbi:Dynamin GTPase effector domain-containing protein, partial [Schizophyllum fasciatum]
PQIKLLEAPSLRCVELVYEELVKICHNCTSVELERFPRLHSALVEVVSDLLRERLGPTSDYASSLIAIQAAYINTNHPAFVSGSAQAAQQQQQASPPRARVMPRPQSTEPINGFGGSENGDDSSEEGADTSSTGTPRSVSASVRDNRHRASLDSGFPTPRPPQRPHSAVPSVGGQQQHGTHAKRISSTSSSPPSARETFLTYFFGQSGPGPVAGASVERGQENHGVVSKSVIPSGRDITGPDNAINSGLLANRQAFDMKSLGKHIEAIPNDNQHLSMREEMETNLIRSLISSYFGIVRQSIQDLVPKAIMHFLVNNTSQQVQNRLVASLYKPELFGDLLNEDESLVAERARVKALLDAYKEAFKTLSDISVGGHSFTTPKTEA